jgi:hypothetical protein
LYGKEASAALIITEPKFDAPESGKTLVRRLQKATPQLKP